MECCCSPTPEPAGHPATCPACAAKGHPVERQTVKALLTEDALRRLGSAAHRFCAEPGCDVVYFDEAGGLYAASDLRVPVWQKLPAGSRLICYCFGENEAALRAEIEATGRSEAVDRVRAHVAAGRCACRVRNPRGVCCLGDLAAAISRKASHNDELSPPDDAGASRQDPGPMTDDHLNRT